MTLGSLSRLFVLRLLAEVGPMTEGQLLDRTKRAGIDLFFGYNVPLSQFLRSLTEEGLLEPRANKYEVSKMGHTVLKQVVDARIDGAINAASRPIEQIRNIEGAASV